MRRFTCETANWHVFARGARRLQLFRDDADFSQFLIYLAYALKQSGGTLWAFALMTNHYHLVIRASSNQLTACMRRLNAMYSRYHNRRYNLDGHTFDGPYQAFRQATPALMLHTIAYVLFNPVKGGLCVSPEAYPWSSARNYVGDAVGPLWIDIFQLMEATGLPEDTAWDIFNQAMEEEARRPTRPSLRPSMMELHQEQFQWLLKHAREVSERFMGEDPTLVAMHWAREIGVTPKAMAKVLGLSNTLEIRHRLHQLHERLDADPTLQAALSLS